MRKSYRLMSEEIQSRFHSDKTVTSDQPSRGCGSAGEFGNHEASSAGTFDNRACALPELIIGDGAE